MTFRHTYAIVALYSIHVYPVNSTIECKYHCVSCHPRALKEYILKEILLKDYLLAHEPDDAKSGTMYIDIVIDSLSLL